MKEKIAILAPEIHEPFIEGIQKNAWAVSQEFSAAGFEPLVFTQHSYGKKIASQALKIDYSINSGKVRPLKYLLWLRDGFRIANLIRREGIRHLFAFSLDWSFFAPILATAILSPKTKIVLINFSVRELRGVNRLFMKIVRRRISRFFVRSVYVKELFCQLAVTESKVAVATVFPQKSKYLKPDAAGLAKLGKIAYLSSAENSAGVGLILDLAEAFPAIDFIVALRKFSSREEVAVETLLAEIAKRRLTNVAIERNISDMPSFYQKVDGVILPPLDEIQTMAAPLVLLEAFASKKLVFVSDLPVFREYGDRAVVFKDKSEIIVAIKKAEAEPDFFRQMAERAFDYASSLPDERQAADIYSKQDYETSNV